jgi:hypothetical protein
MAKGVHRDDFGGVGPLRLLVDGNWRLGMLEIGFVLGLKNIWEKVEPGADRVEQEQQLKRVHKGTR